MGFVVFLLIILVVPFFISQLLEDIIPTDNILFFYVAGFFCVLSIFEIIGVPMNFKDVPVHTQSTVFSCILFSICIVSLLYRLIIKKTFFLPNFNLRFFDDYSLYEKFYLIFFCLLLFIQLYYALFYNIGIFRSDDGIYNVLISDAIRTDHLYLINPSRGYFLESLKSSDLLQYVFCGIYNFYTYISYITHIQISMLNYTFFNVYFLILAHICNYAFSHIVIKERENRLIFMIFISLVYMFGLYSHFSTSFRLFAVLWQGKALLSAVFLPFLLYLYSKFLYEDFNIKYVLFMVVISISAVSFTLSGIVTMIVVTGILTVLYFIKNRKIYPLLLLAFSNAFPCFIGLIYYIKR